MGEEGKRETAFGAVWLFELEELRTPLPDVDALQILVGRHPPTHPLHISISPSCKRYAFRIVPFSKRPVFQRKLRQRHLADPRRLTSLNRDNLDFRTQRPAIPSRMRTRGQQVMLQYLNGSWIGRAGRVQRLGFKASAWDSGLHKPWVRHRPPPNMPPRMFANPCGRVPV